MIVGAGSAGCVLAARLSEDFGTQVLLLEAGGSDLGQDAITIPAAFATQFRTGLDWGFSTQEQKHAQGRRLYWPRGKVLGGSSSMNAMIYIRGSRHDYDEWAALSGDDAWSFAGVLPYFLRAEDNARGVSAYHAIGGPLRVEDQRSPHGWSRARSLPTARPPGSSPTTISTAPSRTAPGSTRSPRSGARASRPPAPTCTR